VETSASWDEEQSTACTHVSKAAGLGAALAHDHHRVGGRLADGRSDRHRSGRKTMELYTDIALDFGVVFRLYCVES